MRPFLSLPVSEKTKVSGVISAFCMGHDIFLGVRSAFEEFGSDQDRIKSVISALEDKGCVRPGLWNFVKKFLEGEDVPDADRIPREVDGFEYH